MRSFAASPSPALGRALRGQVSSQKVDSAKLLTSLAAKLAKTRLFRYVLALDCCDTFATDNEEVRDLWLGLERRSTTRFRKTL